MGTIILVVEYRRGSQYDYTTFEGSGMDYDEVLANILRKARKPGWRMNSFQVTANTFDRGYMD